MSIVLKKKTTCGINILGEKSLCSYIEKTRITKWTKKRKLAQEDKKIKENKYFKIKGSVNRYYKKRESDTKVLHNMMHWTNSTG